VKWEALPVAASRGLPMVTRSLFEQGVWGMTFAVDRTAIPCDPAMLLTKIGAGLMKKSRPNGECP